MKPSARPLFKRSSTTALEGSPSSSRVTSSTGGPASSSSVCATGADDGALGLATGSARAFVAVAPDLPFFSVFVVVTLLVVVATRSSSNRRDRRRMHLPGCFGLLTAEAVDSLFNLLEASPIPFPLRLFQQ